MHTFRCYSHWILSFSVYIIRKLHFLSPFPSFVLALQLHLLFFCDQNLLHSVSGPLHVLFLLFNMCHLFFSHPWELTAIVISVGKPFLTSSLHMSLIAWSANSTYRFMVFMCWVSVSTSDWKLQKDQNYVSLAQYVILMHSRPPIDDAFLML